MTPLRFSVNLASFVAGIFLAVLALFLFVHMLVIPDEDVARLSYQQLLLETTPSPRIIVESGSNSRYGVEPGLIEAAFGRPTIVIADYAGVPLQLRIKRLERYARTGDTIILPLEWEYYFRDAVPSEFLENLVTNFLNSTHYYFDMAPVDRIISIFSS